MPRCEQIERRRARCFRRGAVNTRHLRGTASRPCNGGREREFRRSDAATLRPVTSVPRQSMVIISSSDSKTTPTRKHFVPRPVNVDRATSSFIGSNLSPLLKPPVAQRGRGSRLYCAVVKNDYRRFDANARASNNVLCRRTVFTNCTLTLR